MGEFKCCDFFSAFLFEEIFLIFAGNKNNNGFEWMSLNFDQIPPLTMELAALERLKSIVSPGFLFDLTVGIAIIY